MQTTDTSVSLHDSVLADRARYVSGGVSTPRLVVTHADGARVTDADGRVFLDFAGGIGCQNTGHRFQPVVEAIKAQTDAYLHQCFMVGVYEPYVDTCRLLAEISPCVGEQQKSLLVNSGAQIDARDCEIHVRSTAVPAAIFNSGSKLDTKKICIKGALIIDNGGTHPNVATSCAAEADPFAGAFPEPSSSSCTYSNGNYSGGTVTLKSEQGYNIGIQDFNSVAAGGETVSLQSKNSFTAANAGAAVTLTQGGADSSVVAGTVQFYSSSAFSVSSTATTIVTASTASSLSAASSVDISTQTGANNALDIIDSALQAINSQRATLGATQNRVQNTVSSLQTTSENISAAQSRIRDTDYAAETANLTRSQILQQAGTAILAQANTVPQGALTLLR